MSCEFISFGDGMEALESAGEGDRAGRALLGVAVPAAQTGDAPGGPGERADGMGVLLFFADYGGLR